MSAIFGFILGVIITIVLAILAIFGFIFTAIPGAEPEIADSGGEWSMYSPPVVDAAFLRDSLAFTDDVVVVAVAPESDFIDGHIPGAVQVDRATLAVTDTTAPGIAAWEADMETLLTDLGITRESLVVVYDDGSHDAARLWWVLTQLSHPQVSVLDGGLDAWSAIGEPLETGPVTTMPSLVPYEGMTSESALVSTEQVEAALDDPGVVIVDARPASEYAAGHIPGAVNIPTAANYSATDGALLPIDQLMAVYIDAGVTPDKQVIVYCNSGVYAASDLLALTYLGYPSVALYAGSWPEWSRDPSLPVEP